MKTTTVVGAIVGLIVLGLLGYWAYYQQTPGKLDAFAQCLKDKGAVFYGAFWCPHCQAQKALFGKSAKLLPYTECSLPSKKQNDLCNEKEIKNYPTWVFPDGSREIGEVSLEKLAEKSSCPLPADTAAQVPALGGSSPTN